MKPVNNVKESIEFNNHNFVVEFELATILLLVEYYLISF